jgi:hypothetical protein
MLAEPPSTPPDERDAGNSAQPCRFPAVDRLDPLSPPQPQPGGWRPSPWGKFFACGDADQAVVWCLRTDALAPNGQVRRDAPPVAGRVSLPGLQAGRYAITAWDTEAGLPRGTETAIVNATAGMQVVLPPLIRGVAGAIRRV